MWVYRLGAEKAKRMLLTGDLITGKEAQAMGLIYKSVPASDLDVGTERIAHFKGMFPLKTLFAEVENLVQRMVSIPQNQLIMQKLVINSGGGSFVLFSNHSLKLTSVE